MRTILQILFVATMIHPNVPAQTDDAEVETLIRRFLTPSQTLRGRMDAQMKLVQLGDAAVPALLRQLARTKPAPVGPHDWDDRWTLIEVLSEIGAEEVLPFLATAGAPHPDWTARCKERIRICNAEDRLTPLVEKLENRRERKWAIYKLGLLRDERAIPHLQKIVDEVDAVDLRESAKESIAHITSAGKTPLPYKFHRRKQTFVLQTPQKLFKIGEPILLKYELVAGRYGGHTLLSFPETQGYLLPFGIAGPEGSNDYIGRYRLSIRTVQPNRPAEQIDLPEDVHKEKAVGRFQLAPHERRQGAIDLAQAYKLDQPGEYSVCVVVVGKPFVSSNHVTIQIAP